MGALGVTSLVVRMVFVNDRLVPEGAAMVPAQDHGFLYGHGLFETMRAYDGRIPLLKAHVSRLETSARRLNWILPWTYPYLMQGVQQTLAANDVQNGSVRLTITRGAGRGWHPGNCENPTLLIIASKELPYRPEDYTTGLAALTCPFLKNEGSPLAGIKSTNYLEYILARQWAKSHGADEALMVNTTGYLAEGSMSNIFLVRQGILVTPELASGCLPGIARRVVLQLAGDMGLAWEERQVSPGELTAAEEIFLTNSLMEVMPLTTVDGRQVGSGRPGRLAVELGQAYRRYICSLL